MKKKILTCSAFLLLLTTLAFVFLLPASAATNYLDDSALLLTTSQAATVEKKLREVSEKYDCPVMIVTVRLQYSDSWPGYADELANRYDDVLMLVIDMTRRKYEIEARGKGDSAAMKDGERGFDYLEDAIVDKLSDDNYYGAFTSFASTADQVLDAYASNKKLRKPYPVLNVLIALAAGLIIALIYGGKLKRQLKSVEQQTTAANYVKNGSMQVNVQKDIFLYQTVTRTARPKDTGGSGGGGTRSIGGGGGGHSRGGSF